MIGTTFHRAGLLTFLAFSPGVAVAQEGAAPPVLPLVSAPQPLRPRRNALAFQGEVLASYPAAGRVRLAVSVMVLPNGTELHLSTPLAGLALLGVTGERGLAGSGARRCRWKDLRPGGVVRLYLRPAGRGHGFRVVGMERGPSPEEEPEAAPPDTTPVDPDGVSHLRAIVPMVFPVLGRMKPWGDTFLADRDGGKRRHHGQDLPAPKMRPILAAFDGTVRFSAERGSMWIAGDNGWSVNYLHINNDTPGTDDGQGWREYAIAPGLKNGDHVNAGQMVAFVGDSGNAENTISHLHMELWGGEPNAVINASPSLRAARHVAAPRVERAMPEQRPGDGEVRLDGYVHAIDPARRVAELDVRCVESRGKMRPAMQPEHRWVRLSGAALRLCGHATAEAAMEDLTPGTPVIVIARGSEREGTLAATFVWVETPVFLPSDALLTAMAAVGAGPNTESEN